MVHILNNLKSKTLILFLFRHTCTETVHLLQRRDLCHVMLSQEPQYRKVSCGQSFCSECCQYHTSLLKPVEESNCLKSCQTNDKLAERIEGQFLNMLSNCLNGEGVAFDHCAKVKIVALFFLSC